MGKCEGKGRSVIVGSDRNIIKESDRVDEGHACVTVGNACFGQVAIMESGQAIRWKYVCKGGRHQINGMAMARKRAPLPPSPKRPKRTNLHGEHHHVVMELESTRGVLDLGCRHPKRRAKRHNQTQHHLGSSSMDEWVAERVSGRAGGRGTHTGDHRIPAHTVPSLLRSTKKHNRPRALARTRTHFQRTPRTMVMMAMATMYQRV